jgi:hypothetical protein
MSNEIELINPQTAPSLNDAFGNKDAFEHAQRVAKMISSSSIVPAMYKQSPENPNGLANTMIAMEMSNRMRISPLMVMQNLYVVHGKPSWAGQFVIAIVKASGLFKDVDFIMDGDADDQTLHCRMVAKDAKTGAIKKGTKVTWKMAVAEGWVNKSGSKWKTMPEQMICYRAAAFFGRLYCPELLMGMQTVEEVKDFIEMADSSFEAYINNLITSSVYDEDTKDILREKLNEGLSAEEASIMASELRDNQLDPINAGLNYNQGDIKAKLNNEK